MCPFPTSCLSQSSPNKRRRSSDLRVRFCPQPQRIVYTYSQSDYDRRGSFYSLTAQSPKKQFIVAVSVNIASSPLQRKPKQTLKGTIATTTVLQTEKRNKRPKLTVDTTNLSPLYFTKSTTNYQSKRLKQQLYFRQEDIASSFSSPSSASSPTSMASTTTVRLNFYDTEIEKNEDYCDRLTEENTRRNSL